MGVCHEAGRKRIERRGAGCPAGDSLCAGDCRLLAGLLYQLRNEALVAAKKELGAYAQLTAGHTFEVALGVEEALQLAAMTLSVASGSGAADETQIRQMLRDVAANARVLKDIVVIDATGRTVYQANGRDDIGKDRSSQPYFARFKADPELKFEIAAAARGMVGPADAWSIPMARVWRSSDGAFAGVVVGLLDRSISARPGRSTPSSRASRSR